MKTLTTLALLGTCAAALVAATFDQRTDEGVTFPTQVNHHAPIWTPEFPVHAVAGDSPSTEHARIMKIPLRYLSDIVAWDTLAWVGDLMVGTPPQALTVSFDLWSSNVWIPNKNFGHLHHFYNHNASSTYKANGTKFEYEFDVSGFLSQDTLVIGEVTLKDQFFGEVNVTDGLGPYYSKMYFDGMFGLGFEAGSADRIESPLHRLYRNGLLEEPVAAFYLPDGKSGELALGAPNKQHYTGEITYTKVIFPIFWAIRLDYVEVSGRKFTSAKQVRIDPYAIETVGPKADVDALANFIGVEQLKQIDCDIAVPDISFIIDGVVYILTRHEYIVEVGAGMCMFWIIGVESVSPIGPAWILGRQLMQKYYTVFDFGATEHPPRIGFANATA